MNQPHQYFRTQVELHEIGFYAGFGQLGSPGFGSVGVKG